MKRRPFQQRFLWPSIFLGLIPFLLFRLVTFYEVTFPIKSYVTIPRVFNIDNPQFWSQSRGNAIDGKDIGLAPSDPDENSFGQEKDEGFSRQSSEESIQFSSNFDNLELRGKDSTSEVWRKTPQVNRRDPAMEKSNMEDVFPKKENERLQERQQEEQLEQTDKEEQKHREEEKRKLKEKQEEEQKLKEEEEEHRMAKLKEKEEEEHKLKEKEDQKLKEKEDQKLKEKDEEDQKSKEEVERKLKKEAEKLKEKEEEDQKAKEEEVDRKLKKEAEKENKLQEDKDYKLEVEEQQKTKEKKVKENQEEKVHEEEHKQDIQHKEQDSELRKEEGHLQQGEQSEKQSQENYGTKVIMDSQVGEDGNGNRDTVQPMEGEIKVENAAKHTSDEKKVEGNNDDNTDSQEKNADNKQDGNVLAEVVVNPEKMLKQLWDTRPGDCNLHDGTWEYDEAEPLYTNETCAHIQGDQNCIANGRPDTLYLHLRWRPQGCDLPQFDAEAFMKVFKGKTIGFVGDSLSRNQMQSLVCMLAQVEKPTLVYDNNANVKWLYEQYQIAILVVWSPFLLQYSLESLEGLDLPSVLQLDVLDTAWTSKIKELDIIVLSIGQWYFKPVVYVRNGEVVGCHYCPGLNLTDISFYDVYRDALGQVLDKVASEMKGIVIMSTFAIQHFENGPWENGGDCRRERPAKPEDMPLFGGMHNEMRAVVLDAFTHTLNSRSQGDGGAYFDFLDVTKVSLLRADGHPGPYRRPYPYAHMDPSTWIQNDCLHWCLPGPVDTWNQLLVKIAHRYL